LRQRCQRERQPQSQGELIACTTRKDVLFDVALGGRVPDSELVGWVELGVAVPVRSQLGEQQTQILLRSWQDPVDHVQSRDRNDAGSALLDQPRSNLSRELRFCLDKVEHNADDIQGALKLPLGHAQVAELTEQ